MFYHLLGLLLLLLLLRLTSFAFAFTFALAGSLFTGMTSSFANAIGTLRFLGDWGTWWGLNVTRDRNTP